MNGVPFLASSRALRFPTTRSASYITILVLDVAITVVALFAAIALRFDGRIPADVETRLPLALAALIAIRVTTEVMFGVCRWSFWMSGLLEAMRLAATTFTGTALFLLLASGSGAVLPRSVIALEFFLTTSMMAAYRYVPRLVLAMLNDRRIGHSASAYRTLVVGAGNSGDLLLRDLARSFDHAFFVVGLVDDDPAKTGARIGGKPVLGRTADLAALIAKHRISTVMLAIPSLRGERVRAILRLCASAKASFKIIPASFSSGHHRLTAGMLEDLSPDDLLPRDPVAFDRAEVRALVQGRRILITGGAGSIGGEIAHQALEHGARLLILVDMNENELYLKSRRLRSDYPDADIRAEVADIREPRRLFHLGEAYRPEYVFHAAAHKHVPLMEDAPEEAIKNNVFGTVNVAMMATHCGAERLVFISTDKAVNPSSIMGASKRIGELVVRELASRASRTAITAVRFGNVLGSAGSVVPLFKQQIERGGPVTVTHPECTRFFMTLSEAVGLVLVAGLGPYGDLCVLDMGQAIRISDLAANMITMAGFIPGVEIPIAYTGLRPGEKLHEEPLTEEEERTHFVRSRIKVATSPPPPPDLADRLRELRRLADAGDRERMLDVVRELVPTYRDRPETAPSESPGPSDRAARSLPRVTPRPNGANGAVTSRVAP